VYVSCVLDTPFGQLPILETDEVTLGQSFAIARYLARKFGKSTTFTPAVLCFTHHAALLPKRSDVKEKPRDR